MYFTNSGHVEIYHLLCKASGRAGQGGGFQTPSHHQTNQWNFHKYDEKVVGTFPPPSICYCLLLMSWQKSLVHF